jgi:adenosylcobinamide amidohydrolase
MADIGRGGMNGAVITIEEAKGKLSDALDADTAPSSGTPSDSSGPGDTPVATDSPPPSGAP